MTACSDVEELRFSAAIRCQGTPSGVPQMSSRK
jgi:hypothetical protein